MSGIPDAADRPRARPLAIEDVSSWVLRLGVMASVALLALGLLLSLRHGGLTRQRMERETFVPDGAALGRGLAAWQGFAWLELGTLVLVATPILRVFTAMLLFAFEERDRLYAAVTFLVLVMTLASLLLIR